jgi:transposase-like protein
MPWKESVVMEERLQFVRDALSDRFTMSELCARYGVSRRIGYKWLARYEADGRRGLVDRSRAPHHCPHKIASRIAELLVSERTAHPHWGARKLLKVLATRHPRIDCWPAPSTAADLLARRGLVHKRRRRRAPVHPGVVRPTTAAPNDLWTTDFKGQFRTGDDRYCFPLTIADQHTRFLLACHGLLSTQTVTGRPVFERSFREYGLPIAIRTDNGVPFATQAIHGLSYLNVWWMRLGISTSGSGRAARKRTARTSGCIARSSGKRSNPSAAAVRRNSETSMPSGASTTPSGRMSGSANRPRPLTTWRPHDCIRIDCPRSTTQATSS